MASSVFKEHPVGGSAIIILPGKSDFRHTHKDHVKTRNWKGLYFKNIQQTLMKQDIYNQLSLRMTRNTDVSIMTYYKYFFYIRF